MIVKQEGGFWPRLSHEFSNRSARIIRYWNRGKQNCKGGAFEYVKIVMRKYASITGQRSWVLRLHQHSLSHEQREGLLNLLRNEGIEVKEHRNPDPGSPVSHAYTELKW